MSEIIRYSPERLAMMKALGVKQEKAQSHNPVRREEYLPPAIFPASPSEVIDLPRVCTVSGNLYMARYIDHGGGNIVYGRGIKIVGSIQDQCRVSMQNPVLFRNFPYGEEICPWCGAEGFAAIKCSQCQAEVCWGRTDSAEMFTCICGKKAKLKRVPRDAYGVRPQLPGGTGRV